MAEMPSQKRLAALMSLWHLRSLPSLKLRVYIPQSTVLSNLLTRCLQKHHHRNQQKPQALMVEAILKKPK
jgi:hypothetical protein